jgi:hypothetical protein
MEGLHHLRADAGVETRQRWRAQARRRLLHSLLRLGPREAEALPHRGTHHREVGEARDILNERLGDKAKGVMPAAVSKTRLGELFQDMCRDYENKKQRIDVIEGRWKHLEAFFGDERVKLITTDRVDRYVEVRRKKGAAEQTIGNEMAVLRRMLNLGVKRRKVAKGSLPEFPTIKAEDVRAVFFDDDEFDRLLEALPEEIADPRDVGNDWLLPFVVLARWTGMRRNELLRLGMAQRRSQHGARPNFATSRSSLPLRRHRGSGRRSRRTTVLATELARAPS